MQKHKKVLLPTFALALIFAVAIYATAQPFPYRVAARCNGEANGFATAECACTVANRLSHGWLKATVLLPYYAHDVTPTAAQVVTVTQVLAQGVKCEPVGSYFMFGEGDVKYLNLTNVPPLKRIVHGNEEIWIFEYTYKNRIPKK